MPGIASDMGSPSTTSNSSSGSASSWGVESGEGSRKRPRSTTQQATPSRQPQQAEPAEGRQQQQRCCRIPGCALPLEQGYSFKYRICEEHYRAPRLHMAEGVCRFCQQCSKVHPLSEFEDDRRSCRISLERHQLRRVSRKQRPPHRQRQLAAQQQPQQQHLAWAEDSGTAPQVLQLSNEWEQAVPGMLPLPLPPPLPLPRLADPMGHPPQRQQQQQPQQGQEQEQEWPGGRHCEQQAEQQEQHLPLMLLGSQGCLHLPFAARAPPLSRPPPLPPSLHWLLPPPCLPAVLPPTKAGRSGAVHLAAQLIGGGVRMTQQLGQQQSQAQQEVRQELQHKRELQQAGQLSPTQWPRCATPATPPGTTKARPAQPPAGRVHMPHAPLPPRVPARQAMAAGMAPAPVSVGPAQAYSAHQAATLKPRKDMVRLALELLHVELPDAVPSERELEHLSRQLGLALPVPAHLPC